ncbi:MAG: RNA polymerase sigma factor [Deltaproteobacteria bacterium]|nr:RNA polymerase sigma factor [Deltaproteobacteria bacterium]
MDATNAGRRPAEDDELVRDFLAGDASAFEAIMKRYRRMVYFTALKIVGDHDGADEVAQKTFISAYKNLAGFEGRSSLKTWLFRIASNYSKNFVRDRKRRSGEELQDFAHAVEPSAPGAIEKAQRRDSLREAVQELPARQREVLELRVDHDLSYGEISELLGCSVSAAKVNYHYAVKSLRARMSGEA